MSKKLTDVRGIGEKTAEKLRRRLSRSTGKLGSEVTVGEAARADAVTKSILAADQQRALSDEAISFNPERGARKETTSSRERTRSDTLTRGDFRVQKEAVKTARGEFEDLPEDKRSEDKSGREPVVTDVELWRENINQLDFPGVDTPRSPRVRAEPSDSVLNDTDAQRRPRENWQESQPEPTETQRRLGEEPEKADAERTGIYRAGDGEFVERPLRPAGDGQFVSPNGQGVSQPLQDPTIGRDPDDGEFVDMPLATEPTVPLPDVGGAKGPSDVVGQFVQSGGSTAKTKSFDRRASVGITPDTLGSGFTTQVESDTLSKQIGSGSEFVEQADEQLGLPSADELDSTDVVAEVEVGFTDRDSGFGYDAEFIEARETDDTIFNFR